MPDRLTALDAAFLALERPGLPMSIAGLSVLDPMARTSGPVTLTDLRRLVGERIDRLPRFRQRPRFDLFGWMRPVWEEAPEIDLAYHVRHHLLRVPGNQARLVELTSRLQEPLLDRRRPLWEAHLIDGLEGGRQALLLKTHHAITDGMAGVKVAEILFDEIEAGGTASGGGPPPGRAGGRRSQALRPERWSRPPAPDGLWLRALRQLTGTAFLAVGGPLSVGGPFNVAVGRHRAFATTSVPMETIGMLKRRLGGSVDDVLLALVAIALRDYLAEEVEESPRSVRAMIPVSSRVRSDEPRLGNEVSAMFVELPLDAGDLPTTLRRIASTKGMLRTAHESQAVSGWIGATGLLPGPLGRTAVRLVASQPVAGVIVSDIPGLQRPMGLLGAPIEVSYPVMPLAPTVALSIAAVSSPTLMGIGVTADPGAVRDSGLLAALIGEAAQDAARAYGPAAGAPTTPAITKPPAPAPGRPRRRIATRPAPGPGQTRARGGVMRTPGESPTDRSVRQ